MELAELEKKIKQFEIEHRQICFFGHRDYNCPHIGEKYCVGGNHKECPHYPEQLKELKDSCD